jgi:hypothetical protein
MTETEKISNFALPLPQNSEIFSSSTLLVGENRREYKRKFDETWKGIGPRDGFEAELVHQVVANQWSSRRYRRLAAHLLKDKSIKALRAEFGSTTFMKKKDYQGQLIARAHVDIGVARGNVADLKTVNWALAREGKSADIGALQALESDWKTLADLEKLANDHQRYADYCVQRILEYRKRKAQLKAIESRVQ